MMTSETASRHFSQDTEVHCIRQKVYYLFGPFMANYDQVKGMLTKQLASVSFFLIAAVLFTLHPARLSGSSRLPGSLVYRFCCWIRFQIQKSLM